MIAKLKSLGASINFANIATDTRWLIALIVYSLVIANMLWASRLPDPIFDTLHFTNVDTVHVANVYGFWLLVTNYVIIIFLVINAFNGRMVATTFWVCLAAITIVALYTGFGLCVLVYTGYPYVRRYFALKFAAAVKSVASAPASMPNEPPPSNEPPAI